MPEQSQEWKPSSYNNLYRANGCCLLFSASSGRLLRLTEGEYGLVAEELEHAERHGHLKHPELEQSYRRDGFIVPRQADEREQRHQEYLAHVASEEASILTITPTMQCSFQCSYCIQREARKPGPMSAEVQRQVVRLAAQHPRGRKSLKVEWTGGEPLLAFDIMRDLSEAFLSTCAQAQVAYRAEIATTGSLLDAGMVAQFPRLGIDKVHLTLDGSVETFAARKGVSEAESRTHHDRLFAVMPQLLANLRSVRFKINVDRGNRTEVYALVRRLKEHGGPSPRLDVRLQRLGTMAGLLEWIPQDCLSVEEMRALDLEFNRFLAAEGFTVYGMLTPLGHPCAAMLRHSCVIDSAGDVYRCGAELGQVGCSYANVSDLGSLDELSEAPEHFVHFDPWTIEPCRDCSLLPVCLGDCPRHHKHGGPFMCTLKQGLAERLLFYAEQAEGH